MHNGNKKSKVQCTVSLTSPIRLIIALSIGWSGAETGNTCFQNSDQIKISKNIDHQNAKTLPNVSHISQPTLFSFVPIFNKISFVFWGSFSFVHFPTLFFEQYFCQTCRTLSLDDMIIKKFMHMLIVSSPVGNLDTT